MATLAGIVVTIAGGTAIAVAATSGGPVPRPKPLAVAIRQALAAKPVRGISATVNFTNNLFPGFEIQGSDPLLTGGSGRMWVSNDGRIRLELSGDNGDPEIVVTHSSWWIYDPTLNTVYQGALPGNSGGSKADKAGALPSVAQIQTRLNQLARNLDISGAIPTDVGGQPTYTVKLSPKTSAGLIGQVQLAWDALKEVPLRFAVYPRGESRPVLELAASGVSYGPISGEVFNLKPPGGAHVVSIAMPSGAGASDRASAKAGKHHADVTGVNAVAHHLSFTLAAPRAAGGMTLSSASLTGGPARHGALLVYGRGLGAVLVMEGPASPGGQQQLHLSSGSGDHASGLALPSVSINGASGQQLDTALGTVLRYSSGGVDYTVLGSVRPNVVDAVARSL